MPIPIITDIVGTPVTGPAPLSVSFQGRQNVGGPPPPSSFPVGTTFFWDFGDGNTSTLQNPTHVYTVAGTYTVSFKPSNLAAPVVYTNYITVTTPVPTVGLTNFSATPVAGPAELQVNFFDASAPTPTGWLWDFGDGITSTLQNPTHNYSEPGQYSVTLTPTKSGVTYSPLTLLNYISVSPAPAASYKVKVQGGNVFYSSADPADDLNFNIKGQLKVTTDLVVGNNTSAGGTISTYPGQDLTLSPQANLRLSPLGAIVLNNSAWPAGASINPGQFLGSSSPAIMEFIPIILATGASDNLSTAQLNVSWPFAKTGQWVLGTAAAYLCTGPGTWFRTSSTSGTLTSVNVSGGSTGLTTSGGPITSTGTISLGGVLNLANGGTGGSTAQVAANNILKNISPAPVVGNYLSYNGTDVQWYTPPVGVTSITAGTGLFTNGGASTGPVTINASPLNFTAGTGLAINGITSGQVNLGGTLAFTLAPIGVTPVSNAFVRITTNVYGQTIATTNVTTADITALVDTTYVNVSGDTMTGSLSMGGNLVTSLASPVSGTDATNKNYVDAAIAGLSWKQAVRVATTTNGTLATSFAAGQVIDGVTLVLGNRILIKNQTTQTDNGIYVVTAGAPTRSLDADTGAELNSASLYVSEGTTNADTAWTQITNLPITVGSTNIVFVQFTGSGTYTAGTGLNLAGNTFSNTGVLSTIAGTGITVSGATGNVTIGTANIPNSSLTNSSITVNGTFISLGSSATITAAAGTLTGATLNSTVTASSLTSVGTLSSLAVSGDTSVGGRVLRSTAIGISAAGASQGTATGLTKDINVVSTVSAGQGVALPAEVAGETIIVINTSAATLNVYPNSGGAQIDSNGIAAAFALAAGARIMFICVSATQWYTLNATYA